MRDHLVSPSAVNMCWFSKTTTEIEQYATIEEIKVDKNGEFSNYPKDFLDEWTNQLLHLV